MVKKYLTIEDLLAFCKQSNMSTFSAQKAGGPIVIQSFGEINTDDTTTMGLTPCTLMACHTELNRNKSFISDDAMSKALASFSNRPILGYIHQLDDGTYDFLDHRMDIEEDGDDVRIKYLERPIGVIPESCNAHLEYNEDNKKKYVVVNGYIYDDYGNRALDIIKSHDGKVDVSVELAINEMSYNAKENYLVIEDFVFMGVTCLGSRADGTPVQPGMEGSNLKLDNFSRNENSFMGDETNYQEKLFEILDRLDKTLSNFNNINNKEGVEEHMSHFDELLEQYGFTAEELDFDYANMNDEELDAAFEEFNNKKFDGEGDASGDGNASGDTETGVSTGESGNPDEGESGNPDKGDEGDKPAEDGDEDSNDDSFTPEKKKREENFVKTFKVEISHEEIASALYCLLSEYEEADNEWYYIRAVYDNYFLMQGWCCGKLYKQGYKIDGENVALEGDRQEMFELIVSESEKIAIDKMREDYAELKAFKENYEAAEIKSKKDEIFASEAYDVIRESDAFKALIKNADNYSVTELQDKCDLLFAANVKKSQFSFIENEKKSKSLGLNFNKKPNKKAQAYSGLFED